MSAVRAYDVPAIHCGHCKQSIESTLKAVDGIEQVDVDVPARRVRVTGEVGEDRVRRELDDIGYEVAAVS